MIRLSLILLCAIGTVVVVGIVDEINKKTNKEYDKEPNSFEIEDESIEDIYVKMKNIQLQYNDFYNKISNNLDISEKEYYNYKTVNNRSLPIPIPYTRK